MESEFKAFICALVATPFAFALVAMAERFGFISLTKYGSWQLITFLIGLTFVVAREFFLKKMKPKDAGEGVEKNEN